MTLLAIESATDLVGTALVTDAGAVAERVHQGGRAHAETLAPAIEEVCAASGVTLSAVDTVAVDVGPGLFTGLRVGVATAKALAQAMGIGLVPVTSLDTLAAEALAEPEAGGAAMVVAVVDARRGEVFTGWYDVGGKPWSAEIADPAPAGRASDGLLAPDDLAAALATAAAGASTTGLAGGPGAGGPRASAPTVLVVGDGAARYRELLATVPGVDLSLVDRVTWPSPVVLARLALVRLAAGAVLVPPGDVVPDYRREADARINWEQRIPPPPAAGDPAAGGAPPSGPGR